MQTTARLAIWRTLCRLAPAGVLAACGGTSPAPAPVARPIGGPTVSLQENWRARVLVERDDSIILTLPSGDRQLQQFHRSAVFTLAVSGDGTVMLRLDSLLMRPADETGRPTTFPASWTGRADDPRVDALHVSAGGNSAAELTAMIRNLLPRFPVGGARAQSTWTDSATGKVRVDLFTADERRLATWTAGPVSRDAGGPTIPVRVREEFEQLGSGSQGGHRMTMTSQGSRSGLYYSTMDGRLTSARLTDSATTLISISDTRQVVPTVRYGRSSVRFIPLAREGP